MVIDLKKCVQRPLEVGDSFDLTARFAGHPDIEVIEPVEASLRVDGTGASQFLVSGMFRVRIRAYCGRCLEGFPLALGESFRLLYLPESKRPVAGSGESMMRTDEVDVSYHRDDSLEVLPLLEEQVQLALPMRLLCRQDCRGLCQYCGANRNRADCGCTAPTIDPRLEALKSLLH